MTVDPVEVQSYMEALLGPPVKCILSSSGFLDYECPFPGCSGFHFGVCYDPSSRFSVGTWSCFKCGASGIGFRSLCRSLGKAEQDFVDTVPTAPTIKKRIQVEPWRFGQVWDSIADKYGLSDSHKEMLLRRGIEAEKTPRWFTMPSRQEISLLRNFYGEETAEAVSLKSGQKHSLFASPGRLAIVYPPRAWGEVFTFVSSYKQGEKEYKLVRPRGVSTEGILYNRSQLKGDTLVITEGEVKAEASYQAGLPTVGMLGVGNGRDSIVQCLRFLLRLGFPKHLAFVFDQDVKETSRVPVQKAIERLEEQITRELGTTLKIHHITLPETVLGDKVDIDSYVGFHAEREGLSSARERYRDLIAEGTKE